MYSSLGRLVYRFLQHSNKRIIVSRLSFKPGEDNILYLQEETKMKSHKTLKIMAAMLNFAIFFPVLQTARATNPLEYVGSISVQAPLGRIVADPVRREVYGITATGDVVFINTASMTVQKTISTGRTLRDIDIDSTGQYIYTLDNVTGAYWNQPPATYVLKYDLATQTASDIKLVNAPMYQMALGRQNRFLGVSLNQWVSTYQVNSDTGAVLSTADGGYYGDTTWNPQTFVSTSNGNILFRTEIGISSIELMAYNTSTDSITKTQTREVGSYTTVPICLNTSDTSLYAGGTRYDPQNIGTVLGLYPETIYAATGDDTLAFGQNFVYDPKWGTKLQAMPVSYTMMSLGSNDGYLYAFDSGKQVLHVMKIVPEPVSALLLMAGTLFLRRKHLK
jgi:hypothetical protein